MSYYIDLLNHFWDKDALYGFRPNEVTLYAYLLRQANVARWELLSLEILDGLLRVKFGIAQEALKAARVRLQEAKLIDFMPGNGRGRGTIYELIIPEKVQRKRTLSDQKGGDKGAANQDPLQNPSEEKGGGKVQLDPTLSEAEAAPGADFEASKMKIDSEVTDVTSDGKRATGKKSTVEKTAEQLAQAATYQACIDLYWTWYRGITTSDDNPKGLIPDINAVQGSHMKGILAHLRRQVKQVAKDREETLDAAGIEARVISSWAHVLNNYHLLNEWMQGNTLLQFFRSRMQDILKKLRDEHKKLQAAQQADGTPGAGPAAAKSTPGGGRRGGTVDGLQGLKRDGGPDPGY